VIVPLSRPLLGRMIGAAQVLPSFGVEPQFLIMLQFESAATRRIVAPPWALIDAV
jgi:hypothetical protein